jgi:hypothetical protein
MNFGLVVLIVVCAWSLLAIIAALTFGAMAEPRDSSARPADRPTAITESMKHHPAAASRQRHLAS